MKKVFVSVIFSLAFICSFAQSDKPKSMHEKLEAEKTAKTNSQKTESHRSVKSVRTVSSKSTDHKRLVVGHSSSKPKKHGTTSKSLIPSARIAR